MARTRSSSTASDRPGMSPGLRVFLMACILLFALYSLAVSRIDARLASARDTWEGDQSLAARAYIPAPPLADDAVNATTFMEAAALLVEAPLPVEAPPADALQTDTAHSEQASSRLVAVHHRLRGLDIDRDDPTGDDLRLFRDTLARHALALDVLDHGLERATDARFTTDDSVPPIDLAVPNLLIRLRFASLLRARSLVALNEGRGDDAWADATRVFQLAHWVTDDMPTLINVLVARAIAYQGALLTQTLLSQAPATADVRAATLEWSQRPDVARAVNQTLAGERAVAFETLLDPRTSVDHFDDGSRGVAGTVGRWLFGWSPWRRLNAAVYLEKAAPQFNACATPTHQITDNAWAAVSSPPPTWAYPAHKMYFACRDVAHKRDLWLAVQDHMTVAMRLEGIREATGAYPDTLTGMPIDPFSGVPYPYRIEGNGYRLYSVSTNGQDDGGTLPPAGDRGVADHGHGDLVWGVTKQTG